MSIVGRRFGAMIVLEKIDDRHVRCRCNCGIEEIRTAAGLRRSLDEARTSMCRSCLKRYKRLHRGIERRTLVDCFEKTGSLYPGTGDVEDIPVSMVPFAVGTGIEPGFCETGSTDEQAAMDRKQVAKLLGIRKSTGKPLTAEAVRLIEIKALKKLRSIMRKDHFLD